MYGQLYSYFNKVFSKLQRGFLKGYNAEQYLISKTEKWKKVVDIGNHLGVLLTDLSKAFEWIDHELLPANRS